MNRNYLFCYDNTTQSPATVNVFAAITVATNSIIKWFSHTAGTTDFTCNQAGDYSIRFLANAQKTGGGNRDFSVSIFKGGSEIVGSTIARHFSADNSPQGVVTEIIATLAKSDVLTFRIATSNTTPANMEITPYGPSGANDVSAQITITRVS